MIIFAILNPRIWTPVWRNDRILTNAQLGEFYE